MRRIRALAAGWPRLPRRRRPPAGGPSAPEPVDATAPDLAFHGLTFAYPGAHRPVLHDLDLRVRAGEVLAIVGRNGAGKTTLIKLLAGIYEPTAGRITADGTDLARLDIAAWRRRVTVVFQDFNRYPLTLAENVALGAPEHAHDRAGIIEAVARAGAAELPGGLDTPLTRERAGGTDLSGGQWQRVAIARALFAVAHGRRLLVLDEPTAHLDVKAETEFYQRVVHAVADTTVVLISHRLSTVRHADRIVLLRDGRITEEGRHDELLTVDGEYARLFRLQAARFRDTA